MHNNTLIPSTEIVRHTFFFFIPLDLYSYWKYKQTHLNVSKKWGIIWWDSNPNTHITKQDINYGCSKHKNFHQITYQGSYSFTKTITYTTENDYAFFPEFWGSYCLSIMLTTLFASFENELTIFIKYLTLKRELNVSIKVFLNVVVVLLFVLPREDNDGYSITF